jgi:hypothetical protein
MQFQLRTLFIVMGVFCVYLGLLNAPFIISVPCYCLIAWSMPAYWIAGLVYARHERRAYYLGGVAAGASPYLIMLFFSIMLAADGPWRWGRWIDRYDWDEIWFFNFTASLFMLGPLLVAFLGGWIAYLVHRSVRPAESDPALQTPPA